MTVCIQLFPGIKNITNDIMTFLEEIGANAIKVVSFLLYYNIFFKSYSYNIVRANKEFGPSI